MFSSSVKRGVIAVALFILALVIIQYSYAFGVSTPYIENNTIKIVPGGNYTYVLTAQNGDAEDYYVDISYSSTDNVANLRKETSYLPANTFNTSFYFDITIPNNAQPGKIYVLEYNAKQRMFDETNTTKGLEIQRQANILVIEGEKEIKNSTFWHDASRILLGIIILVLIILIIQRIWKLARRTSYKLDTGKVTNYTISQALNLKEVQILLEKMTDEEFSVPEIKKIYSEKFSELTNNNILKNVSGLSRREVIDAIKRTRSK